MTEDIFAHVDCPDTSKYLEVQWKCKQSHYSGRRLPNLEQNVSKLWNSRDKTLSTQDLQQALESVRLQVKSNIPKEPTALNMHILRNDTILKTQTETENGLGPSPVSSNIRPALTRFPQHILIQNGPLVPGNQPSTHTTNSLAMILITISVTSIIITICFVSGVFIKVRVSIIYLQIKSFSPI